MFTATTGGIDQTSTRPVVISRRMKPAELREQERDQRPEHHRQPTVTAVNPIVRSEHRPELRGRGRSASSCRGRSTRPCARSARRGRTSGTRARRAGRADTPSTATITSERRREQRVRRQRPSPAAARGPPTSRPCGRLDRGEGDSVLTSGDVSLRGVQDLRDPRRSPSSRAPSSCRGSAGCR